MHSKQTNKQTNKQKRKEKREKKRKEKKKEKKRKEKRKEKKRKKQKKRKKRRKEKNTVSISNPPYFLIKMYTWKTQLNWFLPQKELANYGPPTKSGPPLAFRNKAFFEYNHTNSFIYCLRLFSHYNSRV